uniref:Uncharacterized protein n=1 Tax=Kalanchoe fedtschenkoi TaxID=63787 RepID=A0A7N0UE41_KALFE
MARHYYAVGRLGVLRKRWLLLALVAISMLIVLLMNSPFDSCDRACQVKRKAKVGPVVVSPGGGGLSMNPLGFMKSKLVLLVSHEMSLSGGPLLLMELAYMLRGVGAKVCWITLQVSSETDDVVDNLEHKLLSRGVQVHKFVFSPYFSK